MRRRLPYRSCHKLPRTSDSARLFEDLDALKTDNSAMRILYQDLRPSRALYSVCWFCGYFIGADVEHGIAPGVSMDGKAIANRFSLPLFQITERTNCGRMHLFSMVFLHTDNSEFLSWIRTNFKQFISEQGAVVQSPNLISCDGTYSIITHVRTSFPASQIKVDDCHVNHSTVGQAFPFTNRRGIPHSFDEMKDDIHVLLPSGTFPLFNNSRRAFE